MSIHFVSIKGFQGRVIEGGRGHDLLQVSDTHQTIRVPLSESEQKMMVRDSMDSERLETRDTGEKETAGMRRTEDEHDRKQKLNRRTEKQESKEDAASLREREVHAESNQGSIWLNKQIMGCKVPLLTGIFYGHLCSTYRFLNQSPEL